LEEAAADAELYIGIFALVDVSDPAQAKVKEILWRKAADGIDVKPTYLIYSATTRHCIFVGVEAKGESLYSVQQGKTGPARPLGPEGYDPKITGLAFSPDGRYLLYSVRGPARKLRARAPRG
jgi:hypothetical protein